MTRFLAFLSLAGFAAAQEPREIILRSASFEARSLDRIRNYTFQQQMVERVLDSSGKPKKVEEKAYDVLILYGRPYRRLVSRDGRPLSGPEQEKEQRKFDKEMEKRRKESEKERQKRLREEEKDLEEERQFRLEVADAYDFTLLGEEEVAGHPAFVIRCEPKPYFKPRSKEGKILPKLRGKLWISRQDYRWVKVEAELIDTFSIGWLLARLHPGTRLEFEAVKVNDEVWMPGQAYVRGNGRLALLKKINVEYESRWTDYRKFQSDSRIVAITEPQ